jgi:hypothetical protein
MRRYIRHASTRVHEEGNTPSIPIHRVIILVPPPFPVTTATATAALGLATAATSGCGSPPTTSALTRFPTTPSFAVTLGYRRAYEGVVNRDGLVEEFGSVQRFDGRRGFNLGGVFDENVALRR